jgi:hypothetical protein
LKNSRRKSICKAEAEISGMKEIRMKKLQATPDNSAMKGSEHTVLPDRKRQQCSVGVEERHSACSVAGSSGDKE